MIRLKKLVLIACLSTLQLLLVQKINASIRPLRKYTLVVFMAADNNLHPYAWYNIKQMELMGSNENINILVQINTPGNSTVTERYLIEKGKKKLITSPGQAPTQKLNSGDPQTLIDCVTWAMKYYPAENLILNLWSHGLGICDPGRSENFSNESKIDDQLNPFEQRGICFDETYKSYMTNQDIKFALKEIQQKALRGKKIAILWLEACLMSMLEITNIFKDHVEYLVSCENVEYAPGSSYPLVLSIFNQGSPSPHDISCHIVRSFEQIYSKTKLNFTQSAIDLSKTNAIELNVNLVAQQILTALQDQKNKSVTNLLRKCKSRQLCTCFHEQSFIDLRHFYLNLKANIGQISLYNGTKEVYVKSSLLKLLDHGIYLINHAVVANTTGENLKNAGGISIYFPEKNLFNSYQKCNFAQTNNWSLMLMQYILQSK